MKEIVIKGSVDELVECEFYLIMVMGYRRNEEEWNISESGVSDHIRTWEDGSLFYLNHHCGFKPITAKKFLSQFK